MWACIKHYANYLDKPTMYGFLPQNFQHIIFAHFTEANEVRQRPTSRQRFPGHPVVRETYIFLILLLKHEVNTTYICAYELGKIDYC